MDGSFIIKNHISDFFSKKSWYLSRFFRVNYPPSATFMALVRGGGIHYSLSKKGLIINIEKGVRQIVILTAGES